MEVETSEVPEGTEIRVKTDRNVALAVKTGSGERIYLPDGNSEKSTYYASDPEKLLQTEYGYRVLHRGKVEEIEVIG